MNTAVHRRYCHTVRGSNNNYAASAAAAAKAFPVPSVLDDNNHSGPFFLVGLLKHNAFFQSE